MASPANNEPVPPQADERTPLMGREAAEPSPGAAAASRTFSDNIKNWRRQRWISLLIAFILVATIVILTLLFGVFSSRHKMGSSSAICLTAPCVHAASEILYNLSPDYKNVDPCTNFEEFVCDGWRARHDLRSDQGSLSSFSQLQESNQMTLRHILEAPYPGNSDHSHFSPMRLTVRASSADEDNFNEIQKAYNACMSLDSIKEAGVKPIQGLLGDLSTILASGSPTSGDGTQISSSDSKAISDATLYLERLGISSIFSFGDGIDDKNPDTIMVFAGPRSRIGLPSPSYYLDEDTVKGYQSAMAQVFKAVLPTGQKGVDKLAAGVVQFESKIAAATPPLEDLRDVTKSYNAMSLKDTSALVPVLNIEHILTSLVPSNYTLDRMITSFPAFFANVSDILESTSKGTLQAFLSWKVIQATAGLVEAPEIKPYTQFWNKLQGKDPDATTERWRTCISHVDGGLGWILGRFYIETAFSADAKKLGNQIVSDIKEQFITRLDTLDWMDQEVKKLAADKVNAIVQKIGYPSASPNITDPASLGDYYGGLAISDAYFNNTMAISRWSVNQSWAALGKPVDRNEWDMTPPTVNAYYNPAGNEIVFPAGIMQFPAFGGELPQYINYGAFGSVAGHELTHAFDNNGRHYDVHGNLTDWWTNHTVEAFEKRAECFVGEYSNFTAAGPNGTTLHVNGRQTLGENIADAGGLSASFSAWQKRRQEYPDLDLPGLDDFSQEQLFYISFGSFWCSKYTQQALTRSIRTDEHSPAFARIAGPAMMNSKGFREAFDCPVKDPVCELW